MLKNQLAVCNKPAENKSLSPDQVINWEFPALVKGLTKPSHESTGTILHTYFPQTLLEVVMERLFLKYIQRHTTHLLMSDKNSIQLIYKILLKIWRSRKKKINSFYFQKDSVKMISSPYSPYMSTNYCLHTTLFQMQLTGASVSATSN